MILFNNCRNRQHQEIFGAAAIFDLYTTGRQGALAINLPQGEQVIVASKAQDDHVDFKWYALTREQILSDNGTPCRVFFGDPIRCDTQSRDAAIHDRLYSRFFDRLGRFKQWSVIKP